METNIFKLLQNSFDGLRVMPEHVALLEQQDYCLFALKNMLDEDSANADEIKMVIRTPLQGQPNSGIAWLIESWVLQKKNKMEQALSAAEKAVQYAPYTAAAQYNLGQLLLRLRQVDRAVTHLGEAVRLRPTVAGLHYDLGAAFLLQGQFDKTILQFRQGLQIQPRDTSARCYLADVLFEQGRKDEAAREYREVLRIAPTHLRARNGLDAAMAQ